MAGFVKVILIGNLGKDPEVRFTAGGVAVVNVSVACTEKIKGKDGKWANHTEWVKLVAWGKTAENIGQYLSKGSQIYAEGRYQTREWTNKEGVKQNNVEVHSFDVKFLGGGQKKDGAAKPAPQQAAAPAASANSDDPPPFTDDDIPF